MLGRALIRENLPAPRATRILSALWLVLAGAFLAQQISLAQVPPDVQSRATDAVNEVRRPLVTFDNGQLTINANNTPLGDVLAALRGCTGADIDIPGAAMAEHVTAQLGPGPARKILSDLLGWSNFDYVIQGSEDDPLAVQSVTLFERMKGPGNGPVMNSVVARAQPPMASRPAEAPTAQESMGGSSVESAAVAVDTHQDHAEPPAPLTNGLGDGESLQSKIANAPSNNPAGPAPNPMMGQSPEAMAQQLQQMYQQRRLIQEQQNQAVGQRSP